MDNPSYTVKGTRVNHSNRKIMTFTVDFNDPYPTAGSVPFLYKLFLDTVHDQVLDTLDGRRVSLTISYEIRTAAGYSIFHTLAAAIPLTDASGSFLLPSSFFTELYQCMTKSIKGA